MRRRLRAERRALDPDYRQGADRAIRARIRTLPVFRAARRVALFFAFDGEPDLSPLLEHDRRKEFFAPIIAGGDMHFAAIRPDSVLALNRFGIPEPAEPELVDPRALDLVLTPLVAFDAGGNRLGVGAGFYDRCFRFLRGRRVWFRPKLVGTAYALQCIPTLRPNPWDIPLWAAVTEHGLQSFGRPS